MSREEDEESLFVEEDVEFEKNWSQLIKKHQEQLLWIYHSQIRFPEPPYTPEEVTIYIQDVRPYLRRSKFWKRDVPLALTLLAMALWGFYFYQEQKALNERVVLIEKKASEIGWEIDIPLPYQEKVVVSYEDKYRRLLPYLKEGADYQEALNRLLVSFGYEFVEIPSGSFMMGCTEGDELCDDREKPNRQVEIDYSFHLMKYEVTQGLYTEIMGENLNELSWVGKCTDSRCPAVNVSWYDAVRFANSLSRNQGLETCYSIGSGEKPSVDWKGTKCLGWRLLTEAEWEYAARGGEDFVYSGSDDPYEVAWFYDGNITPKAHLVGEKKPNGFGVYDMGGNVWELVFDTYDVDVRRAIRGGFWNSNVKNTRVSHRSFILPSNRSNSVGLRLGKTIVE